MSLGCWCKGLGGVLHAAALSNTIKHCMSRHQAMNTQPFLIRPPSQPPYASIPCTHCAVHITPSLTLGPCQPQRQQLQQA